MVWTEKILPCKISSLLCIAALTLTASVANAGPTVSAHNSLSTAIHSPHTSQAGSYSAESVLEEKDCQLANLAYDFLPPSVAALSAGTTTTNPVDALPAVPAAVFMGIVGFICVSFVRDRRLWLAALAGLLWAGQTGLQAIPRLALQITHRNHNTHLQTAEQPAHRHYFEHPSRLRSDLEPTEYIGLLHHLAAIPNLRSDSANKSLNCLIGFARQLQNRSSRACGYHTKTFAHQLAAILTRSIFNPLTSCPVKRADDYILFSPATIFETIPRGPPCLT